MHQHSGITLTEQAPAPGSLQATVIGPSIIGVNLSLLLGPLLFPFPLLGILFFFSFPLLLLLL